MKKLYLIYSWSGRIEDGWYQWLGKELLKYNVEFIIQEIPNTDTPKINEWVSKVDSIVTDLDEKTYFIGHSIGCQTIMRYLETKEIKKIGGILFVAPWLDLIPDKMDDESNKIAYEWINTPINFAKVKEFANNITAILSDDDYYVSINNEKEFRHKLGAKTIVVHNQGHISGEDGINESVIILESIKEIMEICNL
ncbi:MAG: alpha/beta hydrolase [Clostridia bacterium]|nr:alpha/beta hydrolase [Clostridia bacterium]